MKFEIRKPSVSIAHMGNCRICGQHADLRCGVCWDCMGQVVGEKVSETTHKLWDSENPTNVWYYSETGH